ncbi:MAG TPA: hypothetical protein GX523_20095, partial [Desulfitobacterium dehalogenans]|nr:hypothetical protein [Desulfitobacterium dehalogenans]
GAKVGWCGIGNGGAGGKGGLGGHNGGGGGSGATGAAVFEFPLRVTAGANLAVSIGGGGGGGGGGAGYGGGSNPGQPGAQGLVGNPGIMIISWYV